MSVRLMSPHEVAVQIAQCARSRRLSLNLSQRGLSERSGVSYSVIKKFEQTAKISLESLLKLAIILGCLQDFMELFKPIPLEEMRTLDEVLKDNTRKRGRQS